MNIFRLITLFIVSSLIMFFTVNCSEQKANPFEEGISLEKAGKFEEAIEKYKIAMSQDKENAEIHLRLAISLSQINRLDEAGAHYRESLELDPNNLEAYLNYSGYFFKTEEYNAALLELAKIINLSPESVEAGIAQDLMVRVEKAKIRQNMIIELEKELQAGTIDVESQEKLGKAYIDRAEEFYSQNRIDEAIAEFDKAIALRPKNGEFHYLFAQFLDKIGDKEKAIRKIELANEYEPNNPKFKVSLAGFCIQGGKIEEGKKLLQEVIDLDPKTEEAIFAKRRLEEMEIKDMLEEEKRKSENEEKKKENKNNSLTDGQ